MTLQYFNTPLTNDPVVVADYLMQLFLDNQEDLGIAQDAVYYGDQEKIPYSPAICVEPDQSTRELLGAPRRTRMVIRTYIFIYHGELRDPQFNRRDADSRTTALSRLVHAHPTLDGKVIHSYITEVQSGYSIKQNSTVRSSRVQFECETYDYLPQEV